MKTEFEVISNPDENSEMDTEKNETTKTSTNEYDQNDRSFMLELYKENRNLMKEFEEKEKTILLLKEKNTYLQKSNIFWMCCYFSSVICGVFSISHY